MSDEVDLCASEPFVSTQNHVVRYLAFAGPTYYPSGGACDLVAAGDDFEQVCASARSCGPACVDERLPDWAHVLDLRTGRVFVLVECNGRATKPPRAFDPTRSWELPDILRAPYLLQEALRYWARR